jgi:hypothetical protein
MPKIRCHDACARANNLLWARYSIGIASGCAVWSNFGLIRAFKDGSTPPTSSKTLPANVFAGER